MRAKRRFEVPTPHSSARPTSRVTATKSRSKLHTADPTDRAGFVVPNQKGGAAGHRLSLSLSHLSFTVYLIIWSEIQWRVNLRGGA